MKTAIHHSIETMREATAAQKGIQQGDFVPLHLETRTHVSTAVMCRHLNRKEQTARVWACYEKGPIRATRVGGRLAWPVSQIKLLLGVSA